MPDFRILGSNKTKQKTETNDEIGQMLVTGALDRTEKIRKTAADIFAKYRLEKHSKNRKKIVSGCVPDFPVDLAQNTLNPRTKGWEPYVF